MACEFIEFPLDQEIDGGVPEGAPFNFPVEGGTALFYFTNEEFTRVLSALWNGALITYPDTAFDVIWLFLRNVEMPLSICEQIISCINTDDDVQNALRDFVSGDPELNQNITNIAQNQVLSLENRGRNLLKPDECNPDFIFHQSSVLVQLLHDLTEDMFEAIEVGTNQLERADILVTAVPAAGLNDTAATAFKVADQIAEEIQEDYMGAYDEGMFDDLRCAVFCACKDDCTLSLSKVIEVYQTLLEGEVPADPIEALVYVMQYIVTGDIPTDANVYIMHLFMLTAIQAGTDLLGVDFSRLANRILAAGDDGDNDWETLCEDCPPTETRTPVINSLWDPAHIAGSVEGPDEDGFYTATSESRGTDVAFTLMDSEGRHFVLSETTYSEPPSCQVWLLDGSLDHISCTGSDMYTGQTIDEFTATWSGSGTHTLRFKMLAA